MLSDFRRFDGDAPAAVSIVRYNQRAVPVLSHLAQFAYPDRSADIARREHLAIHKVLHMAPNCMSRQLMKQMDFCTVASPFWIEHLMSSVMFRFAVSSAGYLVQSNEDAKSLLGDSYALRGFAHHLSPHGSLDIPPILQSLRLSWSF